MKKIFLLLAIIALALTVSSQTYQLTRDTLAIPSSSACGFFEDPSGIYFYYLDHSLLTDGIHFYKDNKGAFKPYKDIKFSKEILDACRNKTLSLGNIIFISFDTLLAISDKKMAMIDLKNGKIIRNVAYNTDTNYALINSLQKIPVWNAKRRSLSFRLFNTSEFVTQRKQYYTGKLAAEYFPETGKLNMFPMEYPKMDFFKYYTTYDVSKPIIAFNEDKYIVGFQIIPLTYVYDAVSGKIDTLNLCEEGYVPLPDYKNENIDTAMWEDTKIGSWIFSHTRIYDRLIYDSYKKVYYRFFSRRFTSSDADKTNMYGVTIFDNQLKTKGENLFFDSAISVYYPTSNGIYGFVPDYGFGVIIERLKISDK